MQWRRARAFGVGVLLVFLASAAELARRRELPKIDAALQARVLEQVVWKPDSPPTVSARYAGCTAAGTHGNDTGSAAVYIRYYFFNITNVDDVRKGDKPVLEDVGPFTYLKRTCKLNVSFSADNATVAYNEWRYYLPVPELSSGRAEDAVITTLNVPLVGAIEVILGRVGSRWAPWLQMLARLVEGWGDPGVQGLFTQRTAQELLWGYDDLLLMRAARLLRGMGIDPRFALVRNVTGPEECGAECHNVVATGASELAQLEQYHTWHGVTNVTSWAAPHVERVRGTDGAQFAPGLSASRNDTLHVWVGEVFRAARLVQGVGAGAGRGARVEGVPVLRFRPDPAQRAPDPRYFQSIRGLMNVTSPMAAGPSGGDGAAGPPLFLSLPGYCGADAGLAAGVVGVACDEARHDLFLDVEPTTGVTLRAVKGLMLSSWFGERYAAVDPGVRDTFLPIFWAQETSQATPAQLARFGPLLWAKFVQRVLRDGARPAAIGAGVLGLLCVVAAAAAPLFRQRVGQEKRQEQSGSPAEVAPLVVDGGAGPTAGEELLEGGEARGDSGAAYSAE